MSGAWRRYPFSFFNIQSIDKVLNVYSLDQLVVVASFIVYSTVWILYSI